MQDHSSLARYRAFDPAGPKGPVNLVWADYMGQALAEAEAAAEAGDVPVGALLVNASGTILAKAANRVERDHNPLAHAEMLALAKGCAVAGSPRLTGWIMVVTLEPCLMCAAALRLARIEGVVFGAADLRAGALVSAADICDLPAGGSCFWHLGGIRSAECSQILQEFFRKRR